MTDTSRDYAAWNAKLKDNAVNITDFETAPCGFWTATLAKGGTRVPAAVWRKNGELVAKVNDVAADPTKLFLKEAILKTEYDSMIAKLRASPEGDPKRHGQAVDPSAVAPVKPDAGVGHNNPPLDKSTGDESVDALLTAARGWVPEVITGENEGKLADMKKQLTAMIQKKENDRKNAKEPYLKAGREVDDKFKKMTEPLSKALTVIKAKINKYLAEKQRKLDEERRVEAERLRKEEAARRQVEENQAATIEERPAEEIDSSQVEAPAMPPPEKASVRSESFGGAQITTRKTWKARITDYDKAVETLKGNPLVQEAVQKAAGQLAIATKGPSAIPGVEFYQEESV